MHYAHSFAMNFVSLAGLFASVYKPLCNIIANMLAKSYRELIQIYLGKLSNLLKTRCPPIYFARFLQSTGTRGAPRTYFGAWGDYMYWFLFWLAICNLAYFALHTSTTGSFPKPLSAKEERECLQAVRAGDKEAREKLIVHNLRLVAHIVKRHYSGSKDQDDLISTGTIGLIKAAGTFDCEKGIRFATYASRCIENAIAIQR